MKEDQSPLTFIDLFCGCGGFSLGMERAGLRCLAAIDSNPEAIATFDYNFPHVPHVLFEDLTKFGPEHLSEKLNGEIVDIVIGGPPCQGFSTVRQVDGANHGARLKADARRYLFRQFLRYVEFFEPRVFVMENVLGIQTAANGKFFTAVQSEARAIGYRVHPQVEECWKLGVPQKRRRQLIIGVRNDIPGYFPPELQKAPSAWNNPEDPDDGPKLWDAIGDLPRLNAGEGEEERPYDLKRREFFLETRGPRAAHYLKKVVQIDRANELTTHRARPHSARDLDDFAKLREGEHSGEAEARGVMLAHPYDRRSFSDRYKRQHRNELCSTIVAHLSKDGLMFIHPTQNRSLTPREAARVQSFPDWFYFPIARTHQYRVIGNAVPPLVGEAVGHGIRKFLASRRTEHHQKKSSLPSEDMEAFSWLRPLIDLSRPRLRKVPASDFKRAWVAIAFLYAGLHPDAALDHGDEISHEVEDYFPVSQHEPRLTAPFYERSGWPVVLADIAREAWRRYEQSELSDEEFYCSEAQMAGMYSRNPLMTQRQDPLQAISA